MALYTIKVRSIQKWIYAYDVEADSRQEAEDKAMLMHLELDGENAIDNWILDEDSSILRGSE